MTTQQGAKRRTTLPITTALYGKRYDLSLGPRQPERLREHLASREIPEGRENLGLRGQLVGKLGQRGYGRLLDQLAKVTVEDKPKRKSRPRRRKVAA